MIFEIHTSPADLPIDSEMLDMADDRRPTQQWRQRKSARTRALVDYRRALQNKVVK